MPTDGADREAIARVRALARASEIFRKGDSAVWDALVDALTAVYLREALDAPSAPPAIPQDTPTSPDLARGLRCPGCRGAYLDPPCAVCRGTRTVSRAVFAAWHARRQGR